jgi:probable biosynthetic protein (TIGR04098 family)
MTLKPAMCGPSTLFLAQVGDWTWDAVSEACHTNVFAARDACGRPAYLAFYYYRVRASASFHVGTLTFGDQIEVRSSVFGFGSESVLTLHRISSAQGGAPSGEAIDCAEFYERPRDDCIYVENFNRWVTRSAAKSNEDLVLSSPPEFRVEHLPALPECYSPRPAYVRARRELSFVQDPVPVMQRMRFEYQIDVTRDVNAVGLVYFASYFAIVDRAILRLWRELGRREAGFLERAVLDRQICYLGNVDLDAVLTVEVRQRSSAALSDLEIYDVVLRVKGDDRLIAVRTVRVSRKDSAA